MNGNKLLCDISRSAFEEINKLLSLDQELAQDLRASATTSRQFIREECITALMAARLVRDYKAQVKIVLFTGNEEKKCGADWYWRFERENGAIHACVQAKRVGRNYFDQPDSKGSVIFTNEQLEKLNTNLDKYQAKIKQLDAWVATFARANLSPPCGYEELNLCPLHMHCGECNDIGYEGDNRFSSLWIAKAEKILKRINGKSITMRINNIVEQSIRLDCLLPCIGDESSEHGPASKGFVLSKLSQTFDDCVEVIQKDKKLSDSFEGAMLIKI
ncbi:hypothetical protein HCH_01336 [Hahella chejuensis KCTC 2396]|uniref:Uncharacterized protein n=1 Tax=Hahella chejuensis (strain KCTC 2396) TaxID=349521 RepID=Q2SMC1_HAHCH|nr:DUF6615 family protein [Hahella chejuensis]ABC28203.1 hypothetical protein HCH_01336 [Hahella chejuensis KCTC 2396]